MTARVVLAEFGEADMHAVARALRDGGVEVVFAGHGSPDQVVTIAIQEDADAIAVDDHVGMVTARLKEQNAADIEVYDYIDVLTWAAKAKW